MASIDLTNIFFQLRNNYSNSSSNPAFYDQDYSDDTNLINRKDQHNLDMSHLNMPPKPVWTTGTEAIKRMLAENKDLQQSIKQISEKILSKPLNFHDKSDMSDLEDTENHKSRLHDTELFTQNLQFCEKKLKNFNRWRKQNKNKISGREYVIMENISITLAEAIQNMTTEFSKQNSNFTERLDRQKNTKIEEDLLGLGSSNSSSSKSTSNAKNFAIMEEINLSDQATSTGHNSNNGPSLLDVRINNEMKRKIDERENAITNVTKDIYELNKLFKEVATMVVEQGSVMDRIDYNIEQTAEKVELGYAELEKARAYQKKNKKLNIILCEAITVVFLFLLFVWRHS